MTDYTELKPLLEACRAENCDGPREFRKAVEALFDVCTVETISSLITENERLNAENKQLILLEHYGGTAEAAINLLTDRDQLKAENEALHREREGKLLCHLELFETLRDSANTEADEHRQCMATFRPLRQANLDSVVKKCDDLRATVDQKAPAAEIIWCACGDGHAANSYGAGFMDANNGICANCDAAMGSGEPS